MDELQADLCDFIVEIRKENGEQYPSSSMYDLISGLSLYLEREHGFTNKLVSGAFRSVRNTLENQGVKEFHMLACIGSYCKIMIFSTFKVQVTYYHSSKGNT